MHFYWPRKFSFNIDHFYCSCIRWSCTKIQSNKLIITHCSRGCALRDVISFSIHCFKDIVVFGNLNTVRQSKYEKNPCKCSEIQNTLQFPVQSISLLFRQFIMLMWIPDSFTILKSRILRNFKLNQKWSYCRLFLPTKLS